MGYYFKITRSLVTGEKISEHNHIEAVLQRAINADENTSYIVNVNKENTMISIASSDDNTVEEMDKVLKKNIVEVHKRKLQYIEDWSKL